MEDEGKSQAVAASEILLTELVEKGFPDYREKKIQPYTGNVNFCVSSQGEFNLDDLFVYQVFMDFDFDPSIYEIVAISKNLQNFFIMSQVDGILYDIKDSPYYIHEGEYSKDRALNELEKYLSENTGIDPTQYDFYVSTKHIDGADNYFIVLNRKGVTDWSCHAFEFYVSKDLKRIAQISYDEAMQPQYTCLINLENNEQEHKVDALFHWAGTGEKQQRSISLCCPVDWKEYNGGIDLNGKKLVELTCYSPQRMQMEQLKTAEKKRNRR